MNAASITAFFNGLASLGPLFAAISLGLSRIFAALGGWYLCAHGQVYWGVGLLAGAAGFQVWDAVKVDRQVKAATPPPPPQG